MPPGRGRDPKREKRWKYERTGKKEESSCVYNGT
jgi:hypothetical protein